MVAETVERKAVLMDVDLVSKRVDSLVVQKD